MDTDLVEESMDSIPRPEYEAIEDDDDSTESSNLNSALSNEAITTTTTSTTTTIPGQQQPKEIILTQRVGPAVATEAETFDDEDDEQSAEVTENMLAYKKETTAKKSNKTEKLLKTIGDEANLVSNDKHEEQKQVEPDAAEEDYDDGEEEDEDDDDEEDDDEEDLADQELHAASLRYVYEAEEEEQQLKSADDPLQIQKETQNATMQTCKLVVTEKALPKLATTNAKNIQIQYAGGTAAPVPKMLPVKIKDNKLVMVEMVELSEKFNAITPTKTAARIEPDKIVVAALPTQQQQQHPRIPLVAAPRSLTPLSREFLALQRSVNESKILSEFVTDTASAVDSAATTPSSSLKPSRKLRKTGKDTATGVELQKPYSAEIVDVQRQHSEEQHITAENSFLAATTVAAAATSTPASPPEKTRKHSKFAPLKDEFSISAAETAKMTNNPTAAMRHRIRSRSKSVQSSKSGQRSKSVQRKSSPVAAAVAAAAPADATSLKLQKWPSDEKIVLKRTNMRSQNSEFVQKQLEFLNRVMHQQEERQSNEETMENRAGGSGSVVDAVDESEHDFNTMGDDLTNTAMTEADGVSSSVRCSYSDASMLQQQHQQSQMSLTGGVDCSLTADGGRTLSTDADSLEARMKVIWQPPPKRGWDSFCWKCRDCFDLIPCSKCVRCFHPTCIKINASTKLDHTWICPECTAIENVLNGPKRVRRNDVSVEILSQLLSFALKRMKNVKGYSKSLFSHEHPSSHSKYIVNPVTFSTLHERIEKKVFRCAEEFVNETKWMLHNALLLTIGTTTNSKDVLTARGILKICRQEANEIDTCPECYLNANTRADWFVDVCTQPHLLLWAKLKGFPYWPAKAMGPGTQGAGTHVNVRFFGEHDRAFVPVKDCFLFSIQDPNTQTGKRSARELADCIKEVELHIEKIKAKVGDFRHAPYKTAYDPLDELQQLEQMMPGVGEYMKRGTPKPSLQYKIVKTADNHLSIIKKAATITEAGSDSDHAASVATAVSSPSRKHADSSLEMGAGAAAIDVPIKCMKSSASCSSSNTKYEVITKASNSDESNCSKVSTVILKRKADGSSGGGGGGVDAVTAVRNAGDAVDDIELPLPKMTKIEECSAAPDNERQQQQQQRQQKRMQVPDGCATSAKRKHGTDAVCSPAVANKESAAEGEKPSRSKHVKHESPAQPQPRVPALTIKTNGTKSIASAAEVKETKPIEAALPAVFAATAAQNAMEQLVKHKQGVTIKKITIENCGRQKSVEGAKTTAPPPTTVAAASTNIEAAATTKASEKTKQTTQNVTNILKDLVPFVEVKKEPTSDNDDDDDEQAAEAAKAANALLAKADTFVGPATETTTKLNAAMQVQQAVATEAVAAATAAVTAIYGSLVTPLALPPVMPPVMPQPQLPPNESLLLTVVKQEVLSEDEEITAAAAALQMSSSTGAALVEKAFATVAVPTAPVDALVRVVGDTTIQRISTKQPAANGSQTQLGSAANMAPVCTSTAASAAGKRIVSRGPPFGPLPATAAAAAANTPNAPCSSPPNSGPTNAASCAASVLSAPQQQQQQQQFSQSLRQVHRARKSFLNRSPPAVSPVRPAAGSNLAAAVAPTQSLHSLTAGIAADLKRSLLKTTSMVSIPIHDIGGGGGSGAACNSGRNSIPVPPLTAVSKTTPTSTSAITTQAIAVTAVVCSASATATTFVSCNGGSTTMSAPPPLAGLSQTPPSSVANALPTTIMSSSLYQINGLAGESSPPLAAPIPQTLPAQQIPATLDSHLLGDFVTPTLASAITEVICRGPPKLSVRPNGPLQSDGSAMFPSQAGPVCRTLVENAHKLTDFFISVMEDTMCEMSVGDDSVLQAKITLLTLELERTKQAYEHEIAELKRTSDLMLCEMRKSMENEKARLANEVRKQCELERLRSIEETKKKQWCANCGREAQFYCCWNTSYCDYPCQQLHWSRHAVSCGQTRPTAASSDVTSSSLVTAAVGGSGTTTATAGSNSSGTTAAVAGSGQVERQHKSSSINATSNNSSASAASIAHYNKTVISHKKDKSGGGCGGGSSKSATISAMSMPAVTAAAEVLKLPSNTYLRAVPPSGAAASVRSSSSSTYSMQMPVQRFNIPLPITAPVNTGGPPYTIVQRGTSWQLMSTATSASNVATTSTLAAPLSTVTPASHQQARMIANAPPTKNNSGVGGGSRQRATGTAAVFSSSQQHGGNMLRGTQM